MEMRFTFKDANQSTFNARLINQMETVERLLDEMERSAGQGSTEIRDQIAGMGLPVLPVLLRRVYREIGTEAEEWGGVSYVLEELAKRYPDSLLRALEDTNHEVRIGAVRSMSWLYDPTHVEALIHMLNTEPDTEVQYQILNSLHYHRNSTGVLRNADLLARFLTHEDARFRSITASMLGVAVNKHLTSNFLDLLRDPSDEVRIRAIDALSTFPQSERITQHLIAMLHTDQHLPVRAAAIVALGKVKAAVAVPQLIGQLDDPSMVKGGGSYSHRRICDLACVALEEIEMEEALAAARKWRAGEWGLP